MSIKYLTVPVGEHGEIKVVVEPFEPTQDTSDFEELGNGFAEVMQRTRPDEGSLEFSLAISTEAGVVLAQAGVEGALKVNLTWKRQKDEKDGGNR